MDKTIQKFIINYFTSLESHVSKWNECIDRLKRPIIGLKNQAEQLSHVERVVLNEDEQQFINLKENLTYRILNGIDDEIIIFKNIIAELNSLNQDLRKKLVAFEKSTNDYDWYNEDAQSGSALQPRLSTLLQLAYESWKSYSDMYQNLSTNYKMLNILNTLSIKKLEDSLKLKEDVKKRLQFIVALTQYCNKDVF